MEFAVIGAGAMGSLFGSFLSLVSTVTLIDPWKEHVQAIRENGLEVEGLDGKTTRFWLPAMVAPDDLKSPVDVAIIFTKSNMTASAARKASGVLKQGGVILTLQNGIGNLEIIETEIGVGRTIVGVTSHGGTLLGPGRVRHAGKGMTHIARSLALSRQVDILAAVFQKAEIEVRVEENIESLIWSKLVINAGINALAAILRIPNGILESDEACKRIMFQAVSEAAAVARGLGIQLPYDPQDHVQRVCRLTAGNRASMLQDILRGTKTEINAINEVIVKKGEKLGIPTPCNRFLSEIIKALEATSTHRII